MREGSAGERPDGGRLFYLDLLKTLAVVAMIFSHAVSRFGLFRSGHETEFLFFLGDVILQDYAAVAHAFLFSMGFGVILSRRSTPGYLVRRGVRLYLLGYLLNFCRYGVYDLGYGLLSGTFRETLWASLFEQDVLHFAGLALIATGLFRRMKLREWQILLIALGLSAAGAALPFVDTGSFAGNLLLGHWIVTTEECSCFVFSQWYLFVAAGLFFGRLLRDTADTDRFYRRLLIGAGASAAVYVAATVRFGTFFLSRGRYYYAASPAEAAGLLSLDLFLLSAFYFLMKKAPPALRGPVGAIGRNVTAIYFIQWCLVGLIESLFCVLLETVFSYPVIYSLGAAITAFSCLAACRFSGRRGKGATS